MVYAAVEPWPATVVDVFLETIANYGGVVASHMMPSVDNVDTLMSRGIEKVIVHIRDPRQAVLSWVHFVDKTLNRIENRNRDALLNQYGARYPELSFSEKIDFHLECTLPGWARWIEGWIGVRDTYAGRIEVAAASHTQLVNDEIRYFEKACSFFGIPCSRAEIASASADNVHFRKGSVSEWEDVFSARQKEAACAVLSDAVLSELSRLSS